MKATELLEEQHRIVRALFKRLEAASDHAEQRELFDEIASNLVAHDAIEREIFYPECEKAMGMTDRLGEALVEHGVVEFCLFEADEAKEDQFRYKCTVLSETLDHHIDEEENEFFPEVEKSLDNDRLLSLGEEMQERFDQAKGSDFRPPLHKNLRQVLQGAMKTNSTNGADSTDGESSQRRPAASRKGAASRGGSRSASRAKHGRSQRA